VIGSGPAGERAAVPAALHGQRVAVVERQPLVGGAAVNTGTLPSKTLRETALYLTGFRQRDLHGVSYRLDQGVSVHDLMCRLDPVLGSERQRIAETFRRHGITLLEGEASFIDEHTLRITPLDGAPRQVTADAVLIATGSTPHRPGFVPFDDPYVDDSDTILHLDRIPEALVILGGGVIGCEYGSIFAALGTRVTIVERCSEILGFLDGEINQLLTDGLRKLGCEILLEREVVTVIREAGVLTCRLHDGLSIGCERLLFAGGRAGNTHRLGLEHIGVEPNKRGQLRSDDSYRVIGTRDGRIYAVGDVIGFPSLASVAMEQGRIAVCQAFGLPFNPEMVSWPYGLYTIPEASMIGESEESAGQRGIDVVIGRAWYRDNPRGQIMGDLDGLLKLVFRTEDRRLIGVHMVGERATELIHIGQMVMHMHGGLDDLLDPIFNFPTLADLFKHAAYDAWQRLPGRPPRPASGI
jgi:NAD(P) transhydrogenase